jgi:hypothetical protein
MAEEEQQFHEEEQYEEEGMEADGAGEEGHEDAVDVSITTALAAFQLHVLLVMYISYSFYCSCWFLGAP